MKALSLVPFKSAILKFFTNRHTDRQTGQKLYALELIKILTIMKMDSQISNVKVSLKKGGVDKTLDFFYCRIDSSVPTT